MSDFTERGAVCPICQRDTDHVGCVNSLIGSIDALFKALNQKVNDLQSAVVLQDAWITTLEAKTNPQDLARIRGEFDQAQARKA